MQLALKFSCLFSSMTNGESFGNNAIDPIRRLIDPILIPCLNRGVFDNSLVLVILGIVSYDFAAPSQEIQEKKSGRATSLFMMSCFFRGTNPI